LYSTLPCVGKPCREQQSPPAASGRCHPAAHQGEE
jgi:hypothetical protein